MTALPATAIGRRVRGGQPGRIFSRLRRGSTVEYIELKLEEMAYPSGGYVLDRGVTGMAFITDAEVLSSLDPYGDAVDKPGVQVFVDLDPALPTPKLRIYSEGGFEVEAGWEGTGLGTVWLGIVGTR